MVPFTRAEMYLAAAAGSEDAPATLPTPEARIEFFLYDLCVRISALAAQTPEISPEDIQTAVNEYFNEHGVVIGIRAATAEDMEEAMNNA